MRYNITGDFRFNFRFCTAKALDPKTFYPMRLFDI